MSIPSRLGLGVWFWFPPHRTPEMIFPLQKKKKMDRVKPDRIELRQRPPSGGEHPTFQF